MICRTRLIGICFVLICLANCSVDHGGQDLGLDSDGSDKSISGVVAAGAPVRGVVLLKNANSSNVYLSCTIDEHGRFTIPLIDNMTGPYMLQARGTVGGRSICLHTLGTRSDVSATVNLTPLTDLIVANVTGQCPEDYFETLSNPALSQIATDENLDRYESMTRARFQNLINSSGDDASGFNLINTPFEADHSGVDAMLDVLRMRPQWTEDGQRLNTMIIRSILTGEEIIDDLTDDTETDGFSPVPETDMADYSQALVDIDILFEVWTGLFAASCPDPSLSTLQSLFSDDFRFNGYDRQKFIAKLCADETLIGMTFSGISADTLDTDTGTASVSFTVENTLHQTESHYSWSLVRSDGQWQMRGNQQILDVFSGAYAAVSRKSNRILFNGICLYAYAPVNFQGSDVATIEVVGPGIPPADPVVLTLQDGIPRVFAQTGSRPKGFYQPRNGEGLPSPLRVIDNSRYTFFLYDDLGTVLNPGGYTRIIKRGYGDTTTLLDQINTHAATYSKPYLTLLSEFTGNELVTCAWTLPARMKSRSIHFFGSTPLGEFLISNALATSDLTSLQMIRQTDIDWFDIYLRTVDEFDRTMDTFITKNEGDGRTIEARTLIDCGRLF